MIEQSIKKRRLTDDKQLLPVKINLRFLCTVVCSITSIATNELTLSHLVYVDTVKSLTAHFEQRKIGPARVYVLALLLKKICVYLCSRQSTTSMLYISPQTLPSWSLIDHHCHQSSKKKKNATARSDGFAHESINNDKLRINFSCSGLFICNGQDYDQLQ